MPIRIRIGTSFKRGQHVSVKISAMHHEQASGHGVYLNVASSKTWFIHSHGETLGPLEESVVLLMLKQGRMQLVEFGWREGLADWTRLSELPEFGDLVPPKPRVPTPAEKRPAAPKERISFLAPKQAKGKVRRDPRVEVDGTISLDGKGKHKVFNLSESGLLVKLPKATVSVTDEIKFTLELKDLDKPLPMTGILVREDNSGGVTKFGVEFTRVNPVHLRLLQSYVTAKLAKK